MESNGLEHLWGDGQKSSVWALELSLEATEIVFALVQTSDLSIKYAQDICSRQYSANEHPSVGLAHYKHDLH